MRKVAQQMEQHFYTWSKLIDIVKIQDNTGKHYVKSVLCDICGTTFSETQYYKHFRTLHAERKFKCLKCPKQYMTQLELDNHRKRHDDIREYICDTCGKGSYTKKLLTMHIRQVHLKVRKRQKQRKCRFCGKLFSDKRNALVHERSVHTGERPEKCKVCGNSFYDIVYLREHMRLHTGETPYKCPVCARGYAQRGNMKSHMRNHRISELDPDTLAKIKPSHFKFMKP